MASSKADNVVSSNGCSIQRLPRAWVSLVRPGQSLSVGQADSRLRLLQWNLLADGLAQWGDFIRVRPEVLEWAYRKPLILEEVLQAQADILCFQELNYFDEIKADLAQAGYEGCFLPKRQSPATKYSSPADGVAIFWKANRLTLVERQCLHFTDSNGAPSPQGCMTMLLSDMQGRQLLVATTHLKAKEGADLDAVRLRQMQQVLSSIGATLDRISSPAVATTAPGAQPGLGTPGSNGAPAAAPSVMGSPGTNGASALPPRASMPVIVAGDFNTTPTSMPCQLLASPPWSFQSIWDTPTDPTQPERSQDGGEAPLQGAGTSNNGLCLVDEAALERNAGYEGQPEFSTWKFRTGGESKRIIDHVWFTGLVPVSRWRMLSEEEIGCDGLPCDRYPSDHIALCCEFEFPPK